MASRRHTGAAAGGRGGAGESLPLLGGNNSSSISPYAGAASAAGGGNGKRGAYGSGEQHKALTDDPPDLGTFNQASSMYHLPSSRRRSSWVVLEKPPIRTIDILRSTRRHRLELAVFLVATLLFITVAIVHRAGWTLGHIVTTSVLMPQPVDCPPQLQGAGLPHGGECEASKILVHNTRVNYGLFGRLKYTTTAEASVHTQLTAPGGQTRATLSRTSEEVVAELQEGYQYWGQGFPAYNRHVRATQALVLASWLATCLSLLLLGLVSFRAPASKLATTTTMRAGCAMLIISALALALGMVAWLSIPVSAFSTMCLPSSRNNDGNVACTRLDEAYCEDNCHVDNQVVRTGSMGFGLTLFSALLQCMCAVFWHKLEMDVQEVCENCEGQGQGPGPGQGHNHHARRRSDSPVLGNGVHGLSEDSYPHTVMSA